MGVDGQGLPGLRSRRGSGHGESHLADQGRIEPDGDAPHGVVAGAPGFWGQIEQGPADEVAQAAAAEPEVPLAPLGKDEAGLGRGIHLAPQPRAQDRHQAEGPEPQATGMTTERPRRGGTLQGITTAHGDQGGQPLGHLHRVTELVRCSGQAEKGQSRFAEATRPPPIRDGEHRARAMS